MKKKIISIDVGIKNLAYCIIERNDDNFEILYWDIINILDDKIDNLPKCGNFIKNKLCNKIAVSSIDNNDNVKYFCNKTTCQKFLIKNYPNIKINKLKKINTKSFSLLDLSSILINKLTLLKDIILNVDEVIIENQPVLKNPTMKSIQIVLFSFFVEHGYNSKESLINNIHLFSARDKLKLYKGPVVDTSKIKNNYNKRKFLSIEYTKYYINDSKFNEFFLQNNKKDDLADSFIQGHYYLFK